MAPSAARRRRQPLLLCFTIANLAAACAGACSNYGRMAKGDLVYLNRDLSTGNLCQWTHQDYGLGTDKGGNTSGAGYLWYHANVLGRRAAGLTVTPTAHASSAPSSDSVFLWDPTQYWNYQPHEIWLRTSFMFPSSASLTGQGATGEQPFQPTTGEWNWILVFHNDSSPVPKCAKEFGNVALTVKTDDPVQSGVVGTKNAHLALRIMGGKDCAPNIVWAYGPALELDHWYEILLHVKWNTGRGAVEWYLDNLSNPYYSNLRIATLYIRPNGFVSPSYTSLTVSNYRLHAPWSSTFYLGPLVVGSTKNSVLKAF